MKPLSFRLRIALLSTLISGLVLTGFGAAAWWQIQRLRLEGLDRELRSLAMRHPGWFVNRGGYDRLSNALEFIFGDASAGRLILQVRDSGNRLLYESPQWPERVESDLLPPAAPPAPTAAPALPSAHPPASDEPRGGGPPPFAGFGGGRGGTGRGPGPGRGGPPPIALTTTPRFATVQRPEAVWRLGLFRTTDATLVLGLDVAATHQELEQTRRGFLLALPLALCLIGWGGWIVAGKALRPLHSIAATAERITARGLDQRIPTSHQAPEIHRLIAVLNQMMDRLESSFHQATRFSADASHELKTPLAVMQAEIETALRDAPPASQETLASLLEQIQRLKTITRSLLLLAQADAGRLPLSPSSVNLSAELESLVDDLRLSSAPSHLEFEIQLPPNIYVAADPNLLLTALFNLLDNAIKYAGQPGRVSLLLQPEPHWVRLTLGNSGPGIPAEDRPRIFDRFYRVQPPSGARPEGFGLGLSLAREIVRAHGGQLELGAPRPDWTEFTLLLPRQPAPPTA